MSHKNFLVEIGTEELPPKALKTLGQAFRDGLAAGLDDGGLAYGPVEWFATPRRLAVLVRDLVSSQPDKTVEKFGPAINTAFDAGGEPTPAALGFARSCKVEVGQLEQGERDGVTKLLYRSFEKGSDTAILLPAIVSSALNKLPIPKRMRWGSSKVEFVRPVHWVVMLFGEDVVPATILGKVSGRVTFGHRFHRPEALSLDNPDSYASQLQEEGRVIPRFEARREKIRELVNAEAERLSARVDIDENLLDEVTSLVEWPVALTGGFDRHFLTVPSEALISSMTSHQKCFYLQDGEGKLLPNFIAISNLESSDPKQVIEGNERVIRPRLADADFFYQTDRKQRLEKRREKLKQVVFQQQLGTVYDKSLRVAALARFVAERLGARPELCERAALLAKCDLMTSMVGEFAELQGIMGKYYALHDGEDPEVASALNEQYMPRHAGDELPETLTGSVLALAEKLDTIVGLFAIGQPPTGSKDPFALRRAAIGALRILVEKRLDLDLLECTEKTLEGLAFLNPGPGVANQVFEFFLDRFRFWYQEKSFPAEIFQAVLALRPARPVDFDARMLAVSHFCRLDEAKALASANKRVANILVGYAGTPHEFRLDDSLLKESAEIILAKSVRAKEIEVAPLFEARKYQEGLESLASLKESIDTFFDQVLVMDRDQTLQRNRIALLVRLRELFLRVADISYLHQS
jgi:glycyl-tRNA synthetase beta chain